MTDKNSELSKYTLVLHAIYKGKFFYVSYCIPKFDIEKRELKFSIYDNDEFTKIYMYNMFEAFRKQFNLTQEELKEVVNNDLVVSYRIIDVESKKIIDGIKYMVGELI